jgi:hypothetical protein
MFPHTSSHITFLTLALFTDILAGGLDAGYTFGMLFIFFALKYPKNGSIGLSTIHAWWGNTVYNNTADATGMAYKQIPDGRTFGPSKW